MTAPKLARDTEYGRYYTHPLRQDEKPSITNIINMKNKPLYGSGLKAAARYASENYQRWAELDKEAVYKLVSQPPKEENAPSVIGDIIHDWIDRYINNDPPTPDEAEDKPITCRRMYGRWLKFCEAFKPEFTGNEFTVWSDKYGYAGTADVSFRSPVYGNAHILADAKSGKQPYPEVAMQVAAIANADFILNPDGSESPIPKYDRYAVLHLRPMSYTLHPLFRIDKAFQAFLNLKAVFDWNVNDAPKSIGFASKQTS